MKTALKEQVTSILCSGVGGQGVILASDIMAQVFLEAGYDVKKSEVHGMAQRGGSVVSHVRFGKKIYSPLTKQGDVDILLSFELLEGLRYLDFIKPGGKVVINELQINPPAVNSGEMKYPTDADKIIKDRCSDSHLVKATEIAGEAGDIRMTNVVMLGALSKLLGMSEKLWIKNVLNHLPHKVHALNKKAFYMGREAV